MKFIRSKKCEITSCTNKLTKDPAKLVLGDTELQICEECERLLNIILEKVEEKQSDESF